MALLCACSVFALSQDRTIKVKVHTVFEGPQGQGFAPFALVIENNGANTNAVLSVPAESGSISYPFSLPSGSQKRVVFYMDPSYGSFYGGNGLTVRTDRSVVPIKMPEQAYGSSGNVMAMVSDTPGLLGFMQTETQASRNSSTVIIQPSYVKPEFAPDRLVGYESLTALVLGEGAERLNDAQVEAIQRWVLMGGTVIFIGGSNVALLNDPRWQAVLPLTQPKPITIPSLNELKAYAGGVAPSGSATIVSGKVTSDASVVKQDSHPIIITRHVGLGAVTVFAFDPFSGAMETFTGSKRLFMRYARVAEHNFAMQYLASNAETAESSSPYSSYSYSAGTTGGLGVRTTTRYTSSRENPFEVETPKSESIIWILVGYFAIVVPLNFIVLRLLKKGELAWLTAPVISVTFAFIFFQFAAGLYKSGMATKTSGTLIVDSKLPYNVFIGSSQMFFPRGGGYDLRLAGVDYVRDGQLFDYGYSMYSVRDTKTIEAMNPVDNGEIIAPNMRSSNLGFYQMNFVQNLRADCKFKLAPAGQDKERNPRVRLTNMTPYKLSEVSLRSSDWFSVNSKVELDPGESVDLSFAKFQQRDNETLGKGEWYVYADITKGFRPGPLIGNEVNETGIKLIARPDLAGVKLP